MIKKIKIAQGFEDQRLDKYLKRLFSNLSQSFIEKNLRKKNVFVNLHYIPIHTHPYYQSIGFKWGDFPEAEKYYSEAISLPIFPNLSKGNQDRVVKTLEALLG